MIDFEEYAVVTGNAEDYLNHRQLMDYQSERKECFRWLLTYGKEPDEARYVSEVATDFYSFAEVFLCPG